MLLAIWCKTQDARRVFVKAEVTQQLYRFPERNAV